MQSTAESRLRIGFALDRRYSFLMGQPQHDKESAIIDLARVFAEHGVPYAIMGGVAVQIHTSDPRTTLDVDIAMKSRADVPTDALGAAGFTFEDSFAFSDNWRAPGSDPRKQRTAIQFSADNLTASAVGRASMISIGGGSVSVPVVSPDDLVRLKLAAALEPQRRPSKRIADYGDVVRLLEEHPDIRGEISDLDAHLAKIKSMLP